MRFNCYTNAFVRIMDIVNKPLIVFHFYCVICGYLAKSLEEKPSPLQEASDHIDVFKTTNSLARNSTDNITYTMEEILATCSIKNVTIRTACIAALIGRKNSDISIVEPEVKPAKMFDSISTISVDDLSNHTTLSSPKTNSIWSNESRLEMLIKTNTIMINGSYDKTIVEETLKTTLPASNVFDDRINQDRLSTMQTGLSLVITENKNENNSVNVNSVTETTTQISLVQTNTFDSKTARDSLSSAVLIAPGLPKNAKKVSTIIEDYVTSLGRPVDNHAAANDPLKGLGGVWQALNTEARAGNSFVNIALGKLGALHNSHNMIKTSISERIGLPLATRDTSEVAILGVAGSMMCALCRQQMDITCIARWCLNTNSQSDFGAVA